MQQQTDDINAIRKQLAWRASHRGIKEMDIILGGFARVHLEGLNRIELLRFGELLEESDQDFLSWLTGQSPVPPSVDSPLLRRILTFRPDGAAS